MTCEKCGGTGWEVADRGARACICRAKKIHAAETGTPLTDEAISGAVKALQVLSFFPTSIEAQTVIGDAIGSMCSTVEQVRRLVRRACSLYQRWDQCGLPGLRQIVCSFARPADGIMLSITEAYPDGIPAERPTPTTALALPAPPRAREISGSPTVEAAVSSLAAAKDLNRIGPAPRVREVPLVNVPPEKRITAADVEREVQRLRDLRAKQEMV
jgi:hypothetical protein